MPQKVCRRPTGTAFPRSIKVSLFNPPCPTDHGTNALGRPLIRDQGSRSSTETVSEGLISSMGSQGLELGDRSARGLVGPCGDARQQTAPPLCATAP